jgi:methylmalonyl-CoA mutase N-terminal domain/subunit
VEGRKSRSTTRSGLSRNNISTEETAAASSHPISGHSLPGEPPYTRGIHAEMYKNRLWTMRQYAGFSTAEETNQRFKLLLESGQTGLSVAFDLPTQLGMDSDDEDSLGEVGKVGVPIDSLEDMEALFADINLRDVSTSMTINAPATTLLALYVAAADKQGVDRKELKGTVQNDILKEYIARGLYVYPPTESIRLTTDLFEWCNINTPKWNTISVSGYHIREAGSSAVEELALTLANGIFYAEEAVKAGLNIDDFAPRMSFFFGCHNDFFEEIAKFRAARQLWYELVNERFNPQNPKSSQLRFHTQTAGVTLTAQQPMNNAIRVSYQALSAVLGGTQSLHTNSYDEAIGLPTDESVKIALRTQQIIAHETGVADVVDPLAGSYLVEELTATIKDEAYKMIIQLENQGGVLNCLKSGIQQKMIHESAWKEIKDTENNDLIVVGVNTNIEDEEHLSLGQKIDSQNEVRQVAKLKKYREVRDNDLVLEKLENLRIICEGNENVMPVLIEALKSGATVGEVNGIMRDVFGTWRSPSGV